MIIKIKNGTIATKKTQRNELFPASTFKIPNSLISIEEYAVKDENEVLKWDGVIKRISST